MIEEAVDCPSETWLSVLNDVLWVLSSAVNFEADTIHRKGLPFLAVVTPSWSQLCHVSAPTGNKARSLCFPGQEKYKLHFPSRSLSHPVWPALFLSPLDSFPSSYSLLFLSTSCLCRPASL